jgi:transcriptional regulator with XRE-family HTH domain
LTKFPEVTIFLRVKKKYPKVTKKDAGYYLRVWRAERNLTQSEAAQLFGIGSSFLCLIEAGARFPAPKLAKEFSRITKSDIELFLNVEGKSNG